MKNLYLDSRDVHSVYAHSINHNRCKDVVSMNENKIELAVIGKTKIYVVPPPPMTKEEIDHVLENFRTAGWEIIKSLNRKQNRKEI